MLENLSAHKAPAVAKWLAHPRTKRWHLHYTPTSCSWLNLVEGMVQTAHRPAAPPRNLHQCRCSHRGHCSVSRALEPRPQTLPMAQDRRRHHHQGPPRPNRPHPPNQIRDTPLGTLDFVAARENVVFLGPPGTGKTHLGVITGDVVPGWMVCLVEPSERDCGC